MQHSGRPSRSAAAWFSALAWSLGAIALGACGSQPSGLCGLGGLRPQPELSGEILYSCSSWPSAPGRLMLLDLATGHVQQLTSGEAVNWGATWSPDGRRIAVQSSRDGRADLYLMDVDSRRVHWLTGGAGFNEFPDWSPDGTLIAFDSSRDGVSRPVAAGGFHRSVYLVRPDGSGVRRLTDGPGFDGNAVWSPDGTGLAFTSDRGGAFDLYVMAPDGSVRRELTHHDGGQGFASFASWSPDGTEVVFDASNPPMDPVLASLYRMPSGGGDARRLTAGFDFHPAWSRDGAWITFAGTRNGHSQLFVVRPDGTGLIQLTSDSSDKDWPRWRP